MEKPVIAIGYGGEPLKRMMMERGERLCYLANPERIAAVRAGESNPVGFPARDVYEFDQLKFDALMAKWEATGALVAKDREPLTSVTD